MGYSKPPYYLTAYGLAVRRGFKGTLDEWLASLYGDGVELRYLGEKLQWRKIKGAEDPDPEEGWQDILDVADTREKIFGKALDEANRAENAAGRAEAAAGQIVSVEQAAEIAAAAARDAAQSGQNAKNDADRAAEAAGSAVVAADRAATLIGEAEEYILIETKQQADAAINARHFAEEAAGSAEKAKKRAEEVADSVGSPVSYEAQTLSNPQQAQARKNIGAEFSVFGYRYASAKECYDLSSAGDGSVMLYLFPSGGGYAAVVAGNGAMRNHSVTSNNAGKIETDNRGYAAHLQEINKVYIESGVTTIGDYFMYRAKNLKEVVFEDSPQITRLGSDCFSWTQISGEYTFCNLDNGTTITRSFCWCPRLEGITLDVSTTDGNGEKTINLSEKAFCGCVSLRYFKVADQMKTNLVLGRASFYYCPSLEIIELQPYTTSPEGFNFLMTPVPKILTKYYPTGSIAVMYLPVGSLQAAAWANGRPVITSTHEYWYAKTASRNVCINCAAVASDYDGKKHELTIYNTDSQNKDEYKAYEWTDDKSDGLSAFWGILSGGVKRVPFYGSCWLFSYMHAWNALHPYEQYTTIVDFVEKLKATQITVDTELATALANWDFKDAVAAKYANGYFNEGNSIYATDLPVDMISSDTATTEGEVGTASWAVRKVLGWTGTRMTDGFPESKTDTGWVDIKKAVIDSIFAGKPVIFECVGYAGNSTTASNFGGVHAVTAIGYDATTDMFKIIDSTGFVQYDDKPVAYWTNFEAMLEPSTESAVWIFSAFDSGATITPM